MESSFRTSWVELIGREGADREVRLQAATGLLAPRPAEQLGLLVQLSQDDDVEIARAAGETLGRIPAERIAALLARPDAPSELRTFFQERGIQPATSTLPEDDQIPLVDAGPQPAPLLGEGEASDDEAGEERRASALQKIAQLGIPQRLSLALKGSREERAILIRDPNKVVSLAVLSSPKLTETEVESFARMTSVAEDIPRTIAGTRAWAKSYAICLALVKNPKTPLGISMNMLARLSERDLRSLSTDRNIPDVLRTTARRKVVLEKR